MRTVTRVFGPDKLQLCDACYLEERDKFFDQAYDEALGETCEQCGAYRDARPMDPTYRHDLYSLTEAVAEIRQAKGGKQTTVATAKFTGKLLANTAVMGGKLGWKLLKNAPAIAARYTELMAKEIAKRG